MIFLIGILAGFGAAFLICVGVVLVRNWRGIFTDREEWK